MILSRCYQWRRIAILTLCFLVAGAAAAARADTIDLGIFAFVKQAPGVGFEIGNYTGSQAMPPDFPVVTPLTFTNLTLKYFIGGTEVDASVPDLAPGTTIAITLPDTTVVDSAALTGVLGSTSFLLSDGSWWQAESSGFVTELLPSSGNALTPDLDSGAIAVEADSTVP